MYFKRLDAEMALKCYQLRPAFISCPMNLNRLLILPLMPIAQHFCYSVKQCSCLDNKHLAASSSEGDAAGGFGYVCFCVL